MREYGKEIENLKHILQEFKINEIKSCLYFTHDTKPIYMFSETTFKQHEQEIRKPLEDEIERMGRLIDKLNNDYFKQQEIIRLAMQDLNTAIRDLKLCRTEERLKVITELEEWVDDIINILLFGKNLIDYEDIKQKLNEMKGESDD